MKKTMLMIIYLVMIVPIGAKVEIENKLPKMSLKLLNGKLINISSFLENGPILINFWATWCAPCLKEMKFLDKFNKKYIDSGFQVVSINTDTPRSLSKVKSFVKSRGYSFNILLDPKSEYIRKAGGKVLPYLLLVNTDFSSVDFKSSSSLTISFESSSAEFKAIISKISFSNVISSPGLYPMWRLKIVPSVFTSKR